MCTGHCVGATFVGLHNLQAAQAETFVRRARRYFFWAFSCSFCCGAYCFSLFPLSFPCDCQAYAVCSLECFTFRVFPRPLGKAESIASLLARLSSLPTNPLNSGRFGIHLRSFGLKRRCEANTSEIAWLSSAHLLWIFPQLHDAHIGFIYPPEIHIVVIIPYPHILPCFGPDAAHA